MVAGRMSLRFLPAKHEGWKSVDLDGRCHGHGVGCVGEMFAFIRHRHVRRMTDRSTIMFTARLCSSFAGCSFWDRKKISDGYVKKNGAVFRFCIDYPALEIQKF